MYLFAFRSTNSSNVDVIDSMTTSPASSSTYSPDGTDIEGIKQQLGKCALVIKAFQKHTTT